MAERRCIRFSEARTRSGLAIVTVLAVLATMAVLLVSLLGHARSELGSARTGSATALARGFSSAAADIVVSQIRKSTSQIEGTPGTESWISQPGAQRQYGADGTFIAAFKLYSDSDMVVRNPGGRGAHVERDSLVSDSPPPDWDTQPARYTDLNSPEIRAPITAGGNPATHFPIIDPRAFAHGGEENDVDGFSYSDRTSGGSSLAGVVSEGDPDSLRLPMPVEWIYILRDGSFGTLDRSNRFVGPVAPDRGNPIVGRVAFWADDETSKINLNTASEPTFWAVPSFYHEEDYRWAMSQPAEGEYQRFPGHPATTAISPVLFPNRAITPQVKGKIHDIIPKIADAGSRSGTVRILDDPLPYNRNKSLKERLFASSDELIFTESRFPNSFHFARGEENAVDADLLQRTGFFLTAHSRAPETTLFGTPKIAMWPVSGYGDSHRTIFDRLVAFCSSVGDPASGGSPYFFQREVADSTTHDISIPRNRELFEYLRRLTAEDVPGYGGNFLSKYGEDRDQILVEIFDYVRMTNLYEERLELDPLPSVKGSQGYSPQIWSHIPNNHKTYTEGRFAPAGQLGYHTWGFGYFPGHGQVAPTILEGGKAKGFGRYYTISEVAAHFMCCADGTPDAANPYREGGRYSGGLSIPGPTILKDGGFVPSSIRYWSNFPPSPSPDPRRAQAPDFAKFPDSGGFPYGPDPDHPGYNPNRWNRVLAPDTPLEPGTRRLQSTLFAEWFCPAAGFTILNSHLNVRIRGLANLKLNGQSLYPIDECEILPHRDIADACHLGYRGGSDPDFRGWLNDRRLPARGPMPADPGYSTADRTRNYDLISNFIDVPAEGPSPTMTFQADGPVVIEIFEPRAPGGPELVQSISVRFPPTTEIPVPKLIESGRNDSQGTDYWTGAPTKGEELHAPLFWTYYYNGNGIAMRYSYNNGTEGDRWEGRFRRVRECPDNGSSGGALWNRKGDVVRSLIPWHGDYRLVAAREHVGEDPTSPYEADGKRWEFAPHPKFFDLAAPGAHNFTGRGSWLYNDFFYDPNNSTHLLPISYPSASFRPDFPTTAASSAVSRRFGDFDNAVAEMLDGALINKPDEGSRVRYDPGNDRDTRMPYLISQWLHLELGRNYFSPNRLVASPGMFGSLPTGVRAREPWRTLLFRPPGSSSYGAKHPGARSADGGTDPADHLLMDLFWMPVVEPYVLSDSFSTAGKINLNYQILPFTHIRRATALHGIMKGEMITAVPNSDVHRVHGLRYGDARTVVAALRSDNPDPIFWTDDHGKYWHRQIDIPQTLADFDSKFAAGEAFRSPGQICEMHLIPEPVAADPAAFKNTANPATSRMAAFWEAHAPTGDNTRERPYTNIYPRLTTRSNTWRVHYRAEALDKARSTDPEIIDPDKDTISASARGSTLIERYLDPTEPGLPDHATDPAAPPLDGFYRFRVISEKRFAP